MADRTAAVVLTLNLTLMGHNLAKTGISSLNGPIMRQNAAYRAIFCTLKTTSGFMFLLPVVSSDLATNRKPVGLVIKAIPAHLWAIYTFLGQYSWLKLLPVSILMAQSDNMYMVC